MRTKINYYQLGRVLSLRYPQIAMQLMIDDPIQNEVTGLIPELYRQFIKLRNTTTGNTTTERLEFVAVIVKYADPEALTTKKKLRPGVRAELAKLFNCDETQISHILKSAKNYLEIYKDFQDRVDYLYSELFET